MKEKMTGGLLRMRLSIPWDPRRAVSLSGLSAGRANQPRAQPGTMKRHFNMAMT